VADEALAGRVHARRLEGADQDPGAGGLEDGIERGGEVRATVAEQEPDVLEPPVEGEGAGFPGRPDDFGSALAEDRDRAERFPGWPAALIRDLGRAAEGTEAVMLSEALARVDPARRAFFGGQAALALAEGGLADDARVKIAEQVERWPDDVQARMLAGDALVLLGDAEAALAQYQAALPLAQQAKDYRATRELSGKIFRLTRPGGAQSAQRRQPRARPSRSQRKGKR
jgi:hypothetical protein